MKAGEVFGRWTVLKEADPKFYPGSGPKGKLVRRFECRCACGTVRIVDSRSLRGGRSISCGCYQVEASIKRHQTHGGVLGGRKTPEYKAFQAMNARCYNERDPRFSDYGGRGIKVWEGWRHDFGAFLAHIGPRPTDSHSVDRMNNDRGYEPGNVRWALSHDQMVNRRNSRFVNMSGQRTPLSDVARKHAIPSNTLRWRLLKGWTLEAATTTPVRPKRPKGTGRAGHT